MDFIQHWNNPQFAYLLIPLMLGMMFYAYLLLWDNLRSHDVVKTLKPKSPHVSLWPIGVRLVIFGIIEIAVIAGFVLLLPHASIIWGFIYTFVISVLLVFGQLAYSIHLLKKFGAWHSEVAENLSEIKRIPYTGHSLLRPMIIVCAFALLILAMMEPQGAEQTTRLRRTPMQTTIAFDLSRSMNASDYAPTRLEAAKDEVTTLLKSSHGDELGLVFFTDTAVVQSPQTYDTAWLTTLLKTTGPEDMPTHGTDINAALRAAMTTFNFNANGKNSAKDDHSQRIMLVTDGENHTGDLDATIRELNNSHIHVDVLAIGTENGAELIGDDGKPLMYQGKPVISRLQKKTLQSLAEKTGGIYTRLSTPTIAAQTLLTTWDTIRINVTPHKVSASYYRTPLYRFFLLPAYLLTIIYIVFPIFSWKVNRWVRRRHRRKLMKYDAEKTGGNSIGQGKA